MRWGMMVVLLLAWVGREEAQARVSEASADCGAMTADLNGDGEVDFDDFFILADQFGLTCVAPPDSETTDTSLPVAVASAEPMSVAPGGEVILRGRGSSDPAGGVLVFHWRQLSDNPFPVSFSVNDTPTAFGVRVSLEELGTYSFVLTVTNEKWRQSQPDTVTVMVIGADPLAAMEVVWIEPGTFMMGAPSTEQGRQGSEGPQHQVTLTTGFYLGKYEITQGQWQAVMGVTPWSGQENPNNPAVGVSWNDTQAFVHRVNQVAGDSLYRLPTEAEWEYACRAGTTTRWSFGDDESQLKDYAWYATNAWEIGEAYAHAVGTKKPNPWGLFDMHGNVLEWVQDWYGEYTSDNQTDPMGPATGTDRVLRGGAFQLDARWARSAARYIQMLWMAGGKKRAYPEYDTTTHCPLTRAKGYAHGRIYGKHGAATNPGGGAIEPGGPAARRCPEDAASSAGAGSGRIY